MLVDCPDSLDGANVIAVATPREECVSRTTGEEVEIAAYAIAKYPDDAGYYLLALSGDWVVVGDTYWFSLDEAKAQGEYEASIRIEDWEFKT